MARIAILVEKIYEDLELQYPRLRLKEAGHHVEIIGPKAGETVWGRRPQTFVSQGYLQASIDVEKTPEFRLRISAAGYEPAVSRVFRGDEGQVEYDINLIKSDKPRGLRHGL